MTKKVRYMHYNKVLLWNYFSRGQQPYSDLRRIIVEVSRSYSDTPHSVGIHWTSNRAVTETPICKKHNFHNRLTSIPPAGFEPPIPASEQPQTHALDRAEAEIGILKFS